MPSSEDYRNECLQRIEGTGFIATRPVMGDYIIYVEDRPIGGIYDDRMFLALCEASEKGLPDAKILHPYVGGGEMLLVPDDVEPEKLKEIVRKMTEEIPIPKACKRFTRGN